MSNLPIAVQHRESILQQVADGVRLKDIAKQYGVTKSAITHALSDDPEYIAAKEQFHSARLDQAEEMILAATEDSTSQARARNYWSAVSWRASKEQRDVYGDKLDTHQAFGPQGITINIGTVTPSGAIIEGESSEK